MSKIDARGLSCPQPVIMTLNKLKNATTNEITILVDTDTSKENVTRAAQSQNWKIKDLSSDTDSYKIIIVKD